MRALIACAVGLTVVAVVGSSGATAFPRFIDPAWSPNGKLIAFDDGGVSGNLSDLYVMNADGTNVRKLTNGRYVLRPTWSPDSKRLAFEYAYSNYGSSGIAVMNANGTGLHRILG